MKFTMYINKVELHVMQWIADWFLRSEVGTLHFLGRKIKRACDEAGVSGGQT